MGIPKKFWIPSNLVIFAALVLSVLVTISLPTLPALDIARAKSIYAEVFKNVDLKSLGLPEALEEFDFADEVRFGVWSTCHWTLENKKVCQPRKTGYELRIGTKLKKEITSPDEIKDIKPEDIEVVKLSAGYTRGLAIHLVVSIVIAVSWAFALATGMHTINLLAPLVCVLATVLTFLAFVFNLALFLRVRDLLKEKIDGQNVWKVLPGPGFYITLAVMVLNLAAALILFAVRRRELRGEAAYPALSEPFKAKGFFSRFKS